MSDIKITATRNGSRLTCVTGEGQYLGSLDIDAVNPEALLVLANALVQFAQSQQKGIQVASPAVLGGLNGVRQ